MLVELPWGALFQAGAGPVPAVSAMLLAIALQASAIAAVHRRKHATLAALATLLVLAPLPNWLALVAAAPLAVHSLAAAWDCGFEARRHGRALVWRTHPVAALAAAHLLRLTRAARASASTGLVAIGALLFGGALAVAIGLYRRWHHGTRRQDPALLFAGSAVIILLALAAVAPW